MQWETLFAGLIGGVAALMIQYFFTTYGERRDSSKIYEWMLAEESSNPKFDYRTTRAISKATNIPPERVELLCHKHAKISHCLGDRSDLWNLTGIDPARNKGLWG